MVEYYFVKNLPGKSKKLLDQLFFSKPGLEIFLVPYLSDFFSGNLYLGRPLKNQAPDFFHISLVSEHILHSHIGSCEEDRISTPHFSHTS